MRNTKVLFVLLAFAVFLYASTVNQQLPYSATGGTNNLVSRDANGNTAANNFSFGTNGAACAGTITITIASARIQVLSSGSGTCTVALPDATTLLVGTSYEINNNASGVVTINNGSGSTLTTVPSGGYARLFLLSNSFTAGQWDYHFLVPANAQWGTAGLIVTGTIKPTSGYQSTDGTAGATVTACTGFKNGLCISGT